MNQVTKIMIREAAFSTDYLKFLRELQIIISSTFQMPKITIQAYKTIIQSPLCVSETWFLGGET
jgi:hypothetical protein